MLFIVEGTIHRLLAGDELSAEQAWLGPMVDGGFLQSAFVDRLGGRLWMVIASDSRSDAEQRLGDLPVVRDGTLTFTLVPVIAVRYK